MIALNGRMSVPDVHRPVHTCAPSWPGCTGAALTLTVGAAFPRWLAPLADCHRRRYTLASLRQIRAVRSDDAESHADGGAGNMREIDDLKRQAIAEVDRRAAQL